MQSTINTIDALSIAYSLSVFGIDAEIDTTAPAAPAPVAPAKPIAQMTVRELRDLARGRIKGFMRLSKSELIAALEPAAPAPVAKRRRKAQPEKAAAKSVFVPEYRVRAAQIRGIGIE